MNVSFLTFNKYRISILAFFVVFLLIFKCGGQTFSEDSSPKNKKIDNNPESTNLYSEFSQSEILQDERKILARIPFSSIYERDKIIGTEIDVIGVWEKEIEAILKPSEILKLQSLGFMVIVIQKDYRLTDLSREKIPDPYHTHSEIQQILQTTADENPDFVKQYILGKSVSDRDIIALKITNNPDIEEIEPEVRLLGLHHGNEVISSEFLLYLIRYLVDKYKTGDTEIVEMINTTEIWIVPAVNPDGLEYPGGPIRYNANGVDLNRNYENPEGYHWSDVGGPVAFSEPETRAIRDFSLPTGNTINNTFVLSLAYHTGETCFNYVWNYKPSITPDDYLLQIQGNNYKDAVESAGLKGFWVTLGYYWYQTIGDVNDWAYGFTSTLDSTIECSKKGIPSVNSQEDIDAYCYPHLRGTLYSIWLAGEGIRGRVVDGETSMPLLANIDVKEIGKPVFTDPTQWGDFYRVLTPGTYTVEISANDYITTTITNVFVGESLATQKERNYTDLGVIRIKPRYKVCNLWLTK